VVEGEGKGKGGKGRIGGELREEGRGRWNLGDGGLEGGSWSGSLRNGSVF